MALTNKNLEQIIEAVAKEGFRIQIATETLENVKDIVLARGEMIYVEDKLEIRIGNGIIPTDSLPSITFMNKISRDDLTGVIANSLWKDAQAHCMRTEIKNLLMPKEVLTEFIAQKPDNYSLLQGEPIPSESFVSQFWSNAPDARGVFLRNLDQGANRDSDKNRKIGVYQEDAFQSFGMYINGYNREPGDGNGSGNTPWSGGNYSRIGYMNARGFFDDGGGFPRTSNETRPKNITVLMVWRLY